MGFLLYQVLLAAGLLAAAPFLLMTRGTHYLPTLRSRLGLSRGDGAAPGALWIHAVSVGEVGVAATLVRSWPEEIPLLVTTVTPTGQARARELLAPRGATVTYLPFDLGFAVRAFFRRHRPSALVLVEGDYWPLVLREAKRWGLPVAVVNGRVGRTSHRRLRRLAPLARRLFWRRVDRFGVQTPEDRQRLVDGGADPEAIVVTGNLKFDTPEPRRSPEAERLLAACAAGRPIVLAGSTAAGEEGAVLDALERLGVREGGRPLLALAPRHPERFDGVAREVRRRGLELIRRSAGTPSPTADVVLLDTIGELAGLYREATIAFVGGTLVATGGQNPLEPARFGIPVVVGPSMENFAGIAARFDAESAWARVDDAASLAERIDRWLDRPALAAEVGARGRSLVEANRGATERTLEMLRDVLPAEVRPS